jgi:glyoxylase-like metal-dependent hydrolase (beta-lactamase superfamily II)
MHRVVQRVRHRVVAKPVGGGGRVGPGDGTRPTVPAMMTITGTRQKEAWDRKVLPPVEQVRPGLWSIPVPIPANPLRYVLVYALELPDGVAIVDAGWNTDEAWQALGDGLRQAGGSVSDVRAVLVTHIHPDHYGLAGRVREESGAWIGLHPADADILQARYLEPDDLLARMRVLLVRAADPDVRFEDGRLVDVPGWDLRVVWTPGHSPGHVCFHSHERRLLLSGDHVLPRITPNIGVHTQQHPNPLGQYVTSLDKLRPLPTDEVLPAHEYRFAGLGDRIDQIQAHHRDRLAEIEALLAAEPGATAWDLSVALTWSRPWDQIEVFMQRAAVSETLAHLVVLEEQGRVVRGEGTPARFRRAPSASGERGADG